MAKALGEGGHYNSGVTALNGQQCGGGINGVSTGYQRGINGVSSLIKSANERLRR